MQGSQTTIPRIRRWTRRHQLAAFMGLTYLLTWVWWLPLAIGQDTVESGVGWPTHIPGLLGPALAALLVTAAVHGREGITSLWLKIIFWKVGRWWWLIAATIAAGAIGVAIGGKYNDITDLATYPGVSSRLGAALTFVVVLVANGFGEEIGWRGFAADRLLRTRSVNATALLVAAMWVPWHLPSFFFLGNFESFSAGQILGWVLGLTSGSYFLTWLFKSAGGSVLLVAVWHAVFNFTAATPAASGAGAAIVSTLVMIAAVAIGVADWRSGRTPQSRHGSSPVD